MEEETSPRFLFLSGERPQPGLIERRIDLVAGEFLQSAIGVGLVRIDNGLAGNSATVLASALSVV